MINESTARYHLTYTTPEDGDVQLSGSLTGLREVVDVMQAIIQQYDPQFFILRCADGQRDV